MLGRHAQQSLRCRPGRRPRLSRPPWSKASMNAVNSACVMPDQRARCRAHWRVALGCCAAAIARLARKPRHGSMNLGCGHMPQVLQQGAARAKRKQNVRLRRHTAGRPASSSQGNANTCVGYSLVPRRRAHKTQAPRTAAPSRKVSSMHLRPSCPTRAERHPAFVTSFQRREAISLQASNCRPIRCNAATDAPSPSVLASKQLAPPEKIGDSSSRPQTPSTHASPT